MNGPTRKWLVRVWGALVSVATLILLYGQYQTTRTTLRPTLVIDFPVSSKVLIEKYGPYSHSYPITNSGSVHARAATISVLTKIGGSVVHEDKDDKLGDIPPTQKTGYTVHVHKHVSDRFDKTKDPIVELLILRYEGMSSFMRFWCTPVYTITVEFRYNSTTDDWFISRERHEDERCV